MSQLIISEIQRQADRNHTITVILLVVGAFNALLIALIGAAVVQDPAFVLLVLTAVGVWIGGSYLYFDATVLRATNTRPLNATEQNRLRPIIDRLIASLSIQTPRTMVIDDAAANAFAVGVGPKATLVFTTGLLDCLSDDELEGVAAHELAHVANGDTKLALWSASLLGWAVVVSTIVTFLAIAIAVFGMGLVIASPDNREARDFTDALAGFFAKLFVGLGMIAAAAGAWLLFQGWFLVSLIAHLGVSRQREWLADATAARLTGKPLALASALETLVSSEVKLAQGQQVARSLCIAAPLRSGDWWKDLFDTHPEITERIARLRSFVLR